MFNREAITRAKSTRVWLLVVLAFGILGYLAGSYSKTADAPSASNAQSSAKVSGLGHDPPRSAAKNVSFNEFWELWNLLETKYHKQPLDQKKMLYGAMAGLAASTGDPYTVFFEPTSAEEFSNELQGKFGGIGAEIGIKNEQLQIIAPLPETPASRAGLLAGDAIYAVNGTSTEGMSVERAVSLIRGPKDSKVTLSIGRVKAKKLKAFDVTIVRDVIVVSSVRTKYTKENFAHIQIIHFNADTDEAFYKAVAETLAKDVKGIILDLRNNPGGFLDRATNIAGEWVGDEVVVTERRQGVIVDKYRGSGRKRLAGIPTVILVNEGSASASEILAGALQDYGAAKLVGKKTFGKGSVQDLTEFKDGSAVKITVAEWLTPKGRFINDVGIEPDVTVERTEEDYHANRDPQLDKAVELLKTPEAFRQASAAN